MDILEEKEAFLNVYVNYKGDSRKIQFNEETEQFMWRKNNVSDTEVEYVHLMNQRWYAWLACAKSKAQAVPEWAVIIPRLSANYLFNKVPELGFKHQDEKDTVLYHLNYMASGFKESAKQFVEDNHAKQKAMIEAQEPANY